MHCVLVHGYLLQGTGSNIYVANIARAWKALGHAVTVVCQEREGNKLSFVDEFFGPGDALPDEPPQNGNIRVVVPDIDGLLPVYVYDKYDGYTVKTIPDMTAAEIENHIALTAGAVRQVAEQHRADRVLANHALFGPVITRRGLQGTGVPYDVKIHGSAIEFVLVPHPDFMPYAVEGLGDADRVIAGTQHIQKRVLDVFAAQRQSLQLDSKIKIVPPGMDPDIFKLSENPQASQRRFLDTVRQRIAQNGQGRRQSIAVDVELPKNGSNGVHQQLVELANRYDQRATDADLPERWPALQSDEPKIVYFGKFLNTKGVGELLLMFPHMLEQFPTLRLFLVGFGTYREHLEAMLRAMVADDIKTFTAVARAGDFVQELDFSTLFRPLTPEQAERITITGILDHTALGDLLPLMDISFVPSKLAEAFGMVAVEAMAAGVFPICNDHSGLRDVIQEVGNASDELAGLMRMEPENFVTAMPRKVEAVLRYLYPNGFGDRGVRDEVGRRLRQISVENFSWHGIARQLVN